MEDKFHRTANVFAGWTIIQPRHPPNPDVEKITALDSGGGVVFVTCDVANIDVGAGIIFPAFFSLL